MPKPRCSVLDGELDDRVFRALRVIDDLTEINPKKCSGVPVLRGTRFPLSQLIAELADGKTIGAIANGFELDKGAISDLLHAVALILSEKQRNRE